MHRPRLLERPAVPRSRWPRLSQKLAAGQAGVPRATIGIQDPELGLPTGRRVSVPGHTGFGQLADHLPAQPDPGSPVQLEPQAGRLFDGCGDRFRQAGRLQDDQLHLRPPGDGRQSADPVAQLGSRRVRAVDRPRGQIQEQQIDCSVLEERRRHDQGFGQGVRRQDDEPFQLDPPGHGLHRIEAPGQIHVGGYAPGRLRPRDHLEGQSGLAARPVPFESHGGRLREPAEAEDRVQGTEAGGHDPLVRLHGRPPEGHLRSPSLLRERRDRERSMDFSQLAAPARSRSAEVSAEGLESGLDFRRGACHGRSIVEHTF
jgi:hypothetical protein